MGSDVDAGLHGHDKTGFERSIRHGGYPRCLVDVEADAVAGAVGEPLGPAVLVDHRTAGLVHLSARRSGPDGLDAGPLSRGALDAGK